MSYASREASVDDASPVEFYELRRGSGVWRYTSAFEDLTYNGFPFSAVPLVRSRIEQTQEAGRAALRITLPRDTEVVQDFVATPPSEVTLLTVYRQHREDGETAVVWMGRVLNAEWRGAEVELNCEPVYTSLQRTGLRRLYQRHCPHVLYGGSCRASPVTHRVQGTVSGTSGTTVTVPAAAGVPAGHFSGGYATWSAGGITEKRMIVSHSGESLTLASAPPGLAVGATVMLYPGCDHTLATCEAKFANSANFGGFPFIPTKNPFGGSPIY